MVERTESVRSVICAVYFTGSVVLGVLAHAFSNMGLTETAGFAALLMGVWLSFAFLYMGPVYRAINTLGTRIRNATTGDQ